ncbi:MAG: GAF domain-containing sensor histidine kinase [bacterium]
MSNGEELQRIQSIIRHAAVVSDYRQLCQKIVDVIPQELGEESGCLGAFVTFVDDAEVRGYVITQTTKLFKQSLKLLPKPFNEYAFKLDERSLQKQKMLLNIFKNKLFISDKLSETNSPPAPKLLCDTIQKLIGMRSTVVFPVVSENKIVGTFHFLMSIRKEVISDQLLSLMEIIADQVSFAIDREQLYEKMQNQLKITQQQNKNLQTILSINNQIATTFDFQTLSKKIVNAIPEQLGEENGFLGGTLIFRKHGTTILEAGAVTDSSAKFRKGIKLLPKPFYDYYADYTHPLYKNSLMTKTIINQEEYFTDAMSSILSPLVPKALCIAIQKLLGVKSFALLPLIFEDQAMGVLLVSMTFPTEQLTEEHLQMLRAFADQSAIALRNAYAYYALEQAYSELKALDRAKTDFIAIASHQLRTPYSVVSGYVSLLRDGDLGRDKDRQQQVLDRTFHNILRLGEVIEEVLSLSQIEAGSLILTKQSVDVAKSLKEVMVHIQPQVDKKGLELVASLPKKAVYAELDKAKIDQVFVTLLENAIQYTQKGKIVVSLEQRGKSVHLAVQDSGIGVPKEYINKIFGRFYRAPNAQTLRPDGTGAGLYIAKKIVEAHGGEIVVESKKGKGCVFRVQL